jgi:hypothetical protein
MICSTEGSWCFVLPSSSGKMATVRADALGERYVYCELSSNFRSLQGFLQQVRRVWFRALRRRSP